MYVAVTFYCNRCYVVHVTAPHVALPPLVGTVAVTLVVPRCPLFTPFDHSLPHVRYHASLLLPRRCVASFYGCLLHTRVTHCDRSDAYTRDFCLYHTGVAVPAVITLRSLRAVIVAELLPLLIVTDAVPYTFLRVDQCVVGACLHAHVALLRCDFRLHVPLRFCAFYRCRFVPRTALPAPHLFVTYRALRCVRIVVYRTLPYAHVRCTLRTDLPSPCRCRLLLRILLRVVTYIAPCHSLCVLRTLPRRFSLPQLFAADSAVAVWVSRCRSHVALRCRARRISHAARRCRTTHLAFATCVRCRTYVCRYDRLFYAYRLHRSRTFALPRVDITAFLPDRCHAHFTLHITTFTVYTCCRVTRVAHTVLRSLYVAVTVRYAVLRVLPAFTLRSACAVPPRLNLVCAFVRTPGAAFAVYRFALPFTPLRSAAFVCVRTRRILDLLRCYPFLPHRLLPLIVAFFTVTAYRYTRFVRLHVVVHLVAVTFRVWCCVFPRMRLPQLHYAPHTSIADRLRTSRAYVCVLHRFGYLCRAAFASYRFFCVTALFSDSLRDAHCARLQLRFRFFVMRFYWLYVPGCLCAVRSRTRDIRSSRYRAFSFLRILHAFTGCRTSRLPQSLCLRAGYTAAFWIWSYTFPFIPALRSGLLPVLRVATTHTPVPWCTRCCAVRTAIVPGSRCVRYVAGLRYGCASAFRTLPVCTTAGLLYDTAADLRLRT